ncbi:MAG: type IV pilus assembly protein FimV, partial [Gammaproteobacteria bacterium]
MTMPRIAACLLALLSFDAAALSLGQLATSSRLGEPLDARIALYAAYASELDGLRFELRPDIMAPRGGAERAQVAQLTVTVSADTRRPVLELRSATPITEPLVRFRLRATSGAGTVIKHYNLALSPPANGRARASVPVMDGAYGPVRPGQTLWRILRELGLSGGDTQATIDAIVAANPRAFVGGDANRLRVGAMLNVPATATVPQASAAPVVTAPPRVARPAAAATSGPAP